MIINLITVKLQSGHPIYIVYTVNALYSCALLRSQFITEKTTSVFFIVHLNQKVIVVMQLYYNALA